MFFAYQCGPSYSTAPLTEYANNELPKELPKERSFFTNTDEKLYIEGYTDELEKLTRDDSDITLTVKLKAAATKKLKLRVTGYSQGRILLYSVQQRHDNVL